MGLKSFSAAALMLSLGIGPAAGQVIGTYLPAGTAGDLVGGPAGGWNDLRGRTLLIEFFAYW